MTPISWFRFFIVFWTFLSMYFASFWTYPIRIITNKLQLECHLPVLSFSNSGSAEVNQTWGPQNTSRSITLVTDGLLASSLLLQENMIQFNKNISSQWKENNEYLFLFFFSWEVCSPNIWLIYFFVFLSLWGLYYFRQRPRRGWLFKIIPVTAIRGSNNFIKWFMIVFVFYNKRYVF